MKSLLVLITGMMISFGAHAHNEAKAAEGGKPMKAATAASAAPAASPMSAMNPIGAARAAEPVKIENKADDKHKGAETAGKGEMKEVCHDKMGKDGKPVMGKDGKPVQECKKVKVRQKLESHDIPPAKK